MGLTLKTFKDLTSDFNKSIDSFKESKNVTSVEKLPSERKAQVQFLQAFQRGLANSNIKIDSKAKAFTGAMLIINQNIANSYYGRSPSNSNLYSLLKSVIGIESNKQPSTKDTSDCVNQALNHFRKAIAEAGNFEKGFKTEHDFSDIKGNTALLDHFWKTGTKMLETYSNELFDQALQKHLKENAPKSKGFISSLKSNIFSSSSKNNDSGKELENTTTSTPSPK